MRWFLDISFRGAPYHGWQIQPGDVTVQQQVEQALSMVLKHRVSLTGAGRTDAGVNARQMPAHFDTDTMIDPVSLCRSLNAICRPDIAVNACCRVHDDAHARFDACARTYRYFVHTRPDPFAYRLSWQVPASLDFGAMNEAALALLGTHDFTSFSKLHTDVKTNICTVTEARWVQSGPHNRYFEITADRFLRNMVRAVVGTLMEVGRGKVPATHIAEIMRLKDRCRAGTSVPGHALFLWKVDYPYNVFEQ